MNETRTSIIKVFRFYLGIFFILGLYIVYLMGIDGIPLAENSMNPRNLETISRRGKILARSGQPLAFTKTDSKRSRRIYPGGAAAEPLVGYLSERYGKGGLEDRLDKYLRVANFSGNPLEYLMRYRPSGQNVYLTIDGDIQKKAYEVIKGERGAVIVMNPRNGEILALASSPSFDPGNLENDWNKISKDKDAPLLLRPVSGHYPPGSVFKPLTYAASLAKGVITPDSVFYCSGDYPISYAQGIYNVRDFGGAAHGSLTGVDALVNSCNISFAQIALKLGAKDFVEYSEKFGMTSKPDFILDTQENSFPKVGDLTDSQLAQSSFGQGKIYVSPLSVALMISAFAADGNIYEPQLIKARVDENGKTVYKSSQRIWKTPITADIAHKVRDAMVEVVNRGTGVNAQVPGVSVAGKTGSAENPAGETHAWFAGFAPADKPEYLVVVIVENGGAGGAVAAPKAGEVLKFVLKAK